MSTDKQIVDKILKGDMRAVKTLIQLNERLVAHIVGKLILDKEDAKDLCQEVFIKVYNNIKSFKFQSKLSTWIGSIAYKESLNYLKKKKLNVSIAEWETFQFVAKEEPADNLIDKKHVTSYINHQISTLPEQYKIVLTLFHLEEMSYEEIIEITGMPEGTVKNYLFRARKLLKEKLEKATKERLYENL